MLKLILFLLAFSFLSYSSAQEKSIYNWDSALSLNYNTSFIKAHQNSDECFRAYYELAWYYRVRKKDSIKLTSVYREVLSKKISSAQRNYFKNHFYPKIYNEGATHLYKHFKTARNYDSALYYLNLCVNVYKYQSDCGNDYAMHHITYACDYADIYTALNQKEKALDALLKEAFNRESNTHIKRLQMILSGYDTKQVKEQLEIAINKVQIDSIQSSDHDPNKTYYTYHIDFMNNKIYVPFYYDSESRSLKTRKSKIMIRMRSSEFYKMVMSLP